MGVKITGPIEPLNSGDSYPVIDPIWGIDGLRCVSSLSEMYNIPLERRRGGMLVGVQQPGGNSTNYYALKTGVTWSVGTSSDWYSFAVYGASASPVIRYNIVGETVTNPINNQYLVYGNLTIGTGGNFVNSGNTVIINGSLTTVGSGTYSNTGTIQLVTLATTNKYTATFSLGAGQTLTVTHSLSTEDIVFSVRDGLNFVYPDIQLIGSQSFNLTTTGTISNGKINVIS